MPCAATGKGRFVLGHARQRGPSRLQPCLCPGLCVHAGDLKCANVVMDERLQPRVADFGLSAIVDINLHQPTLRAGTLRCARWQANHARPTTDHRIGLAPHRTTASD